MNKNLDATVSPMMVQYWQIKNQHSDCLLFFRMGDFYELFFDDAVIAAKDLEITLTRRGQHKGEEIPMCGVPVHSHEVYLSRLIQKGHKVAVCEQLESPEAAKKRGSKAPLERGVIRIITPGTITEEGLLPSNRYNFLIALSPISKSNMIGIATIDISTGAFFVEENNVERLASTLTRLNPAEIILPDALLQDPIVYQSLDSWKKQFSPLPLARFDFQNGKARLEKLFQVKTLEAFGNFSEVEIRAAGVLVDYIEITQKQVCSFLDYPRQINANSLMVIDPTTKRSLEIDSTLNSGNHQDNLFNTINLTVTASGARLLAYRLSAPLINPAQINKRLDQVSFFIEHPEVLTTIRGFLKVCPDLERSLSRLCLGRGMPRDLAAIGAGLNQTHKIKACLGEYSSSIVSTFVDGFHDYSQLVETLSAALAESLPANTKEGGYIAANYNQELDEQRELRDNGRAIILDLQQKYSAETGINTLKIRHNNVLGYHIDINPNHASKMGEGFIHRQSLASSMRYTTTELAELEKKIDGATFRALNIEMELFLSLVEKVQQQRVEIQQTSRGLAKLDVAAALAQLARTYNYARPTVDNSLIFSIQKGRHPVVDILLKTRNDVSFVPNDCLMNDETKLLLLTGPNMAGKSTYLRQNALITILAQMGSYVPAESAHIGIVDRIFSRVGAADDLASGRSTFMVEMVETAAILHQATDRSFVILDEIGRGTATYDGLSIAWAVIEALCHKNKSRTLFATHYHELTHLAQSLSMLSCLTMKIKEWNNDVIFLHQVAPGQADKSYGIHVAALAGLPKSVIERASHILVGLESKKKTEAPQKQLPLPINSRPVAPPSKVEELLKSIDVDQLTPRQALDQMYYLKGLV